MQNQKRFIRTTTPRYNSAFWNYQRDRVYDTADLNGVCAESAAGYFIPNEGEVVFRAAAEKTNIFRRIASVISTESGNVRIKTMKPTGAAEFVGENLAYPKSENGYHSFATNAHKIAKLSLVSNKCLNDAGFDIVTALLGDMGREFGKAEEDACINGDGTTRPFGLLHPSEGAEVGVTADGTLSFDDVKALFFSLDAEHRREAAWLMNDETAFYLRTLKDDVGNYLWRDADDTILGHKVYTSPYMPQINSGNSPILFGDFSYYWFMERGGLALQPLRELYAEFGATAFAGTAFVDGRLVRREAVKALTTA
ncbi:MAG: phage major capsid protein [Oscillospiraceae bacterium]|nr:phage major capsid protein [Oscillospiraceae bacterium]